MDNQKITFRFSVRQEIFHGQLIKDYKIWRNR